MTKIYLKTLKKYISKPPNIPQNDQKIPKNDQKITLNDKKKPQYDQNFGTKKSL